MSYSKKDILTASSLMLWIITFAIIGTVFFKPLYYTDIYRLGIDTSSGMEVETIKENYHNLIEYQSIFYQGELQLPDFVMSPNGSLHFEEVKRIFEGIQILLCVTTITSAVLVYQQIRKKEYRFLRLTSIITVAIPSLLGVVVMSNFNAAFVIFHKLLFRNEYWVFDSRTDPVIQILPQPFFMHCFMMIIFMILMGSAICYYLFRYQQKKIVRKEG